MSDFWETLQDYAENAPEAGYANVNYGKLTTTPYIVTWETNEDGKRVPNKVEMKPGQSVPEGASVELHFDVEIAEFNESLQFSYGRNVPIRKSSTRQKTDWTEIVEPSLVKVFGEKWGKAIMGKTPYVCIEDAANVNGNKSSSTQKVYGVPKFLEAYKNKAECQTARDLRFRKRDEVVVAPDEDESEPQVTDDILKQVKGLIKSVGEAKALKMLKDKPFGEFDPQVLLDMAKAADLPG